MCSAKGVPSLLLLLVLVQSTWAELSSEAWAQLAIRFDSSRVKCVELCCFLSPFKWFALVVLSCFHEWSCCSVIHLNWTQCCNRNPIQSNSQGLQEQAHTIGGKLFTFGSYRLGVCTKGPLFSLFPSPFEPAAELIRDTVHSTRISRASFVRPSGPTGRREGQSSRVECTVWHDEKHEILIINYCFHVASSRNPLSV